MAEGAAAPAPAKTLPFGQGLLKDCWWFAALSNEVAPGSLRRHEILSEPVLIGRTRAGQVFALRDICPHRAAPLSAGRIANEAGEGETVECPYHGWRFRLDGVCAAIPSLTADQTFEVDRIKVRSYPVRESQGLVFVWIGSDPRVPAEPKAAFDSRDGPRVLNQRRLPPGGDVLAWDSQIERCCDRLPGAGFAPGRAR